LTTQDAKNQKKRSHTLQNKPRTKVPVCQKTTTQ